MEVLIQLRTRASSLVLAVLTAFGIAAPGPTGAAPGPTGARQADFRRALHTPLLPDPQRLAEASPDLRARLAGDAFTYFRFLNARWAQRTCEVFAAGAAGGPPVRLHGDAHVEQYAFTTKARGLDDFDDSAVGPAVIDLVRFIGSIELAARARGWSGEVSTLVDAFLGGYSRGVEDRGETLPPDPEVVTRLRATRTRSDAAFLAWAESLMQPVGDADRAAIEAALERLDVLVRAARPDRPAGFLRAKRVGWLTLGVGSALTPKVLVRVEGPGPGPDDDVILEAKQATDLRGISCLDRSKVAPGVRIVTGIEQLGRLTHGLLAVVPRAPAADPEAPEWWVRSWDASYAEVTLGDYASAAELRQVVHDAGAQLGAGAYRGASREQDVRREGLRAVARLHTRIREVAHQLTLELLDSWSQFRQGTPAR